MGCAGRCGDRIASKYPIRGLVLASGYYFPTWRLDFWMVSGPAIPVLGDMVRYTVAPIISWAILPALFRKLFAPRSIPANFKDGFPTSLMVRPKQLRAAAEESAFLIPEAARLQSRYSSIRCPVHIFHGTGDQLIEPEQARRLHKVVGRSDLHLVNDAGHMVTYADGGTIAQGIDSLTVGRGKVSNRNDHKPHARPGGLKIERHPHLQARGHPWLRDL